MRDNVKLTGLVTATLRGPNGKIKDRFESDNLVVTGGRQHIADQLAAIAQASMSHMAIGAGTTSQTVDDSALESEVSRRVFVSKAQGAGADSNKVLYVCDWAPGEGTGAITEAGIFNAATAGTMLCRTTFPVKNKGAGDSLTLTWTLTVSG